MPSKSLWRGKNALSVSKGILGASKDVASTLIGSSSTTSEVLEIGCGDVVEVAQAAINSKLRVFTSPSFPVHLLVILFLRRHGLLIQFRALLGVPSF